MYINRLNIPQNLLSWGYLSVPAIYHGRSWGWLSPCEGNSTSLLILSGLHHDFGTFFSGELAVALFKTLPKAFHAILRKWKRPLYYGRSPKVWDIIGIVDKGLVGFSLCRVVFALGQAKFCVFANFIRIARLFWHFSQGNWLLSLFSCVVFKRMQKICETSPWLVAFERTCSYQFSLWETLKKQIIHTGILDFWFLAAQFPQSVPATANGSQTWFFSNADERQEKWVNVFKTAYFFGQGPSCRPTYAHK